MRRVAMCRDARSCVRCVKGYSVNTLTSILVSMFYNGRTTVRPYKGLLVRFAELCDALADHRRTQQLDGNPNAALTEQIRQNISSLSNMDI